jgi:hypothetical protein
MEEEEEEEEEEEKNFGWVARFYSSGAQSCDHVATLAVIRTKPRTEE